MPAQHQFHNLVEKLYDPETGHGGLECVLRQDGRFDITVHHNDADMTVYGLTRSELLTIGRKLTDLARDETVRHLNEGT